MKITLHQNKCLSCGMCASIAPELFSLETGLVTTKKQPETYTEEDKKLAIEASEACPNGVIDIET